MKQKERERDRQTLSIVEDEAKRAPKNINSTQVHFKK